MMREDDRERGRGSGFSMSCGRLSSSSSSSSELARNSGSWSGSREGRGVSEGRATEVDCALAFTIESINQKI